MFLCKPRSLNLAAPMSEFELGEVYLDCVLCWRRFCLWRGTYHILCDLLPIACQKLLLRNTSCQSWGCLRFADLRLIVDWRQLFWLLDGHRWRREVSELGWKRCIFGVTMHACVEAWVIRFRVSLYINRLGLYRLQLDQISVKVDHVDLL